MSLPAGSSSDSFTCSTVQPVWSAGISPSNSATADLLMLDEACIPAWGPFPLFRHDRLETSATVKYQQLQFGATIRDTHKKRRTASACSPAAGSQLGTDKPKREGSFIPLLYVMCEGKWHCFQGVKWSLSESEMETAAGKQRLAANRRIEKMDDGERAVYWNYSKVSLQVDFVFF